MVVSLLERVEEARASGTNRYIVEIRFLSKILGTQPKSADVMRAWLESQHLDEETIQKQTEALGVEGAIAKAEDQAWTTFFRDGSDSPYIGTYQVKAMIREMLTTLGITVAKRGSKQTFQHLLEVWACDDNGTIYRGKAAEQLVFWRDGAPLENVDGDIQMTAHVQTAQGPRSVIKRHDYIESALLRFLIVLPARLPEAREKAAIDDTEIARIFAHAGNDGLGCSRSQGYGRFELVRLDKLTDNPAVLKSAKPEKGKPGRKPKNAAPVENDGDDDQE